MTTLFNAAMLRKGLTGVAVLVFIFVFAVLLSGVGTGVDTTASVRSVEVGVATVGPAGLAGGFAIPASCPSDLHDAPANYGSSCTSSPNMCGQTNTGTIQCNGSCPATTPSDSECVSFSISPTTLNEGDAISIAWDCVNAESASGGGPFPGPGKSFSTGEAASGSTAISGPEAAGDHVYQVSCSTGATAQRTVMVREPDISIMADPSLILLGETSEISWSAFGVNSCIISGLGISESSPPPDLAGGATWSDSATTPPLDAQAQYRITCETAVRTIVERVTVNVIPEFEEI